MSDLVQRRKAMAEGMMREAIGAAATTVLAEVGFGAMTMDRVAEAAGVSKGTLYNYFQDKDALAIAIVDQAFADVSRGVDRALASDAEPLAALVEVVRVILTGVEERRALGRALRSGELSPRLAADLRGKRLLMRGHFVAVCRRAAAAGRWRAGGRGPEAAGRLLAMLLDGVIDERMLHGEECPPVEQDVVLIERLVLRHWFTGSR